ncbi:MAG: LysR substrate-binding domain-containing protein [Ferrimicrobium sp.]
MTDTQLRTLIAVADAGSLAGAARGLVVSQAAISSTISSLERSVGATLTVRDGRTVRLTPAGVVLTRYARRLLGLAEEAQIRTREAAESRLGILRIGAVATVGEDLLPRWLHATTGRLGGLPISLQVANKRRLLELLEHHQVDLVVSGRPEPGRAVSIVAERRHRLLLVVAREARSQWFPAGESSIEERLGDVTWLIREPGSGTRASAEEIMHQMQIVPPTLTIGSNLAIKRAVLLGLGVAVLSQDAVGEEVTGGSIVSLHTGPFPDHRTWCLLTRQGEPLSQGVSAFLDALTEMGEVEIPR